VSGLNRIPLQSPSGGGAIIVRFSPLKCMFPIFVFTISICLTMVVVSAGFQRDALIFYFSAPPWLALCSFAVWISLRCMRLRSAIEYNGATLKVALPFHNFWTSPAFAEINHVDLGEIYSSPFALHFNTPVEAIVHGSGHKITIQSIVLPWNLVRSSDRGFHQLFAPLMDRRND
jgi:hypothetical protein